MDRSYRVKKYVNAKGWFDYGPLPETDVKAVIRGYRKNDRLTDLFIGGTDLVEGVYTRKGTTNMFTVKGC